MELPKQASALAETVADVFAQVNGPSFEADTTGVHTSDVTVVLALEVHPFD
jgi:hypothetical protein